MIELQNIKFKEIRPFISKINPISICRHEDLSYENFLCLEDVPEEYSELYIYGIGPVDNASVELENVKYYPGYITRVTEQIPDGMSFNSEYSENKGWEMSEDGILYNRTLENELIKENEKKYLTVAFDITRKEAGSFINYASADEVKILGGEEDEN